MARDWILYGASGVTGAQIAEVAVRRRHRPLLVGRAASRLAPLAERLGLEWAVADIADEAALAVLVGSAPLTLLAASPFTVTGPPLLRACLAAGVHYLDIANEPGVFETVYGHDQQARRRGAALLLGAGFGVTATDPLARHVADALADADRLDLTYCLYTAGTSPGAHANALSALASGGQVRRTGRLVPVGLGASVRRAERPGGDATVFAAPLGDLAAAYRTAGIADITVETAIAAPSWLARLALPVLPVVARSRALQRRAARATGKTLPLRDPSRRTYVRARASAVDGRSAEAWLATGKGYAFTAEASVRAVESVLAGPAAGSHSPGGLLGADFPLDIPGTRRFGPPATIDGRG
ncbi:saccharopine dehydrogenase family protein [Micromonospora echinofusca]|uniref:Saccharopine dehydrogenase NADP binding domain-containing protein n=1 Tax=Micromonospora echinofusca TaxID=47858 RepID=A0ABS3VNP0_MICEH|nr:saccharopine dehydrogenase NADP-binding domain-containing protein [Micromonospora echinofusca]MBO4206170.1 hypothetical protein [Micromonospora echinofusca]